ncbi:MAG: ASCH domain-containing protein [Candidatus Woesearchaeota archaeon]|nr:ASCH domain-containing protein [Candidatus Woesearchaeota archaeon]
MKTLSLKQPYAELILQGRKKIELRKWNTNFRGEFLIHASKTPDKKNMEKFGFNILPCGFIVGKASIINVKKYKDDNDFNNDKNLHLATKDWGTYGFILENVKRVKPIPVKGKLNFWEFKK